MDRDDRQLHYETIETRARPARVAILVDSSDADWRHTTVRIIEFLSSIWGGKHSVIVPTDGSTIEPIFWSILERFSPDYVYFYRKTGADIKISHPEEYGRRLRQQIERYEDAISAVLNDEKEQIDRDLQTALADNFHLDADLCSQIVDRLVPFHFEKNINPIFNGYIPNELTDIANLLPFVDHARSFASFDVSPEIDKIWWAAHTGAYSAERCKDLPSICITEEKIPVSLQNLDGFTDWILGRDPTLSKINELLDDNSGFVPPESARANPFNISMSGTALYGPIYTFRASNDQFAFVLGNSIQDFCLSYCFPRIGYPVAWLPSAWIDKRSVLSSSISSVLYAAPYNVRRSTGIKACSLSMGMEDLSGKLAALKSYFGYGLNGEKISAVQPASVVQVRVDALIPYCEDSPNHPEIYPFLGEKSAGAIRSPKPTGFSELSATKHRWVAEVTVRGKPVPTAPHVAETLVTSGDPGAHSARPSQHALAYACPGSIFIIGENIDQNLQNPEIKCFNTLTAVSIIAELNDCRCQISDKGIYQRVTLDKFGGVSKIAKLLRDQNSSSVFARFLDHKERKMGTHDEGCVLHADKRTYLDLAAVQKLMGDENAAVTLLDNLTAAKIIYRGFVLLCAECKHAEWYSLADLADEFKCRRCGREQTIRRQHWKHPAAPQIFYKLDEIVYQFLRGDGDVVALSLDYMARNSKHELNYSPEIEFRRSDSTVIGEIDLCAVYDGVMTIGEAKKNGELAPSNVETRKIIDKYLQLATMLYARRVLFCTTSPEWKNGTVEDIRQAFQGKLATPMFLAAAELFGGS